MHLLARYRAQEDIAAALAAGRGKRAQNFSKSDEVDVKVACFQPGERTVRVVLGLDAPPVEVGGGEKEI